MTKEATLPPLRHEDLYRHRLPDRSRITAPFARELIDVFRRPSLTVSQLIDLLEDAGLRYLAAIDVEAARGEYNVSERRMSMERAYERMGLHEHAHDLRRRQKALNETKKKHLAKRPQGPPRKEADLILLFSMIRIVQKLYGDKPFAWEGYIYRPTHDMEGRRVVAGKRNLPIESDSATKLSRRRTTCFDVIFRMWRNQIRRSAQLKHLGQKLPSRTLVNAAAAAARIPRMNPKSAQLKA